jgi:hypothetical protein
MKAGPTAIEVQSILADVKNDEEYDPTVQILLHMGDENTLNSYDADDEKKKHLVINCLRLNEKHIPDLVKLIRDKRFYDIDVTCADCGNVHDRDEDEEVDQDLNKPITASEALLQLNVKNNAAISQLVPILQLASDPDDDMIRLMDNVEEILQNTGPVILPHLFKYIKKVDNVTYGRATAASVLGKMGNDYPEHKQRIGNVLRDVLQNEVDNIDDEDENAGDLRDNLVYALIDIKHTEAVRLIGKCIKDSLVSSDLSYNEMIQDMGLPLLKTDSMVTLCSKCGNPEERDHKCPPKKQIKCAACGKIKTSDEKFKKCSVCFTLYCRYVIHNHYFNYI